MCCRTTVKNLLMALALMACSLPGAAQQQPQQQQPQQQQPQQQQPQKESWWQKVKRSAQQQGQTAAQQGAQQVQQVQQNVQQQIPVVGGQGNQMVPQNNQMAPQSPCGSLTGAAPANGMVTNAGAGGGAGSCGPNCFDAGPFSAAVTQMTMSQQGYWHIIRMNMQFHNATNQPLIIAYHEGSMVMVDDQGNTYQAAGGNPGAVQGMGIDRGGQTDSQFVLGPGQTGNAMFSVARSRSNTSAIGNAFAYNFTIDELQAQNGADAIPVRQYNLNFSSLVPGSMGTAVAGSSTATSVVGGGKRKGSAVSSVNSYLAGTAPAAAVPQTTGQPAAAVSNVAPVAGNAIANPAAVQAPVNPRAIVNPASRASVVNPAVSRPISPLPQNQTVRTVSNAAQRSAATTPGKPAAPVRPIPAKTASKPAANSTATTATSK